MADIAIPQNPQLLEVNPPLVQGNPSLHDLTDKISGIVEGDVIKTPTKYWIVLGITSSIVVLLLAMLTYLVATGIGVWGNNKPIGWAWDITNFVFWIGIGKAGTLISAILFLFRQKWRTSINRSAEAMTLFAVMCAAIFPLFHTGRPWRAFYWLFPIPNTDITMWQNFRSPLIWDVFAVSTYLTGSILFWYTGLVPDVATLLDRAKKKIILVTGSIVGYAYACEFFIAWYSGSIYERFTFVNRAFGPYWWAAWTMYSCNVFIPQLYWFKKMRTNLWVMFIISITTNIGMWFERFVIIATSLTRDYLPSSWGYFKPTWVDICTFIGTIGLFLTLFLLFARFLPMIAMSEVKAVRVQEQHTFAAAGEGGHH